MFEQITGRWSETIENILCITKTLSSHRKNACTVSKQMRSFNQFAFPLTHLSLTFWRSLCYEESLSAVQGTGFSSSLWDLSMHLLSESRCRMLVILSNWIVFNSKYREETFQRKFKVLIQSNRLFSKKDSPKLQSSNQKKISNNRIQPCYIYWINFPYFPLKVSLWLWSWKLL